ncbi:hypothetical protein ACFU9W_47250 [Streptomyces sp. NPDC057600]|uniref:hypothetical protein n=1 Tax=Streptomyces sp. NPDC057600 TaxID=3346180 RepID=UPI0036C49779
MLPTRKRGNMNRNRLAALVAGIALTGAAALATTGPAVASQAAGTPRSAVAEISEWSRYGKTYQGSDRATWDRVDHDFNVCDQEKDGHPVYAYFTAGSEDGNYYYDRTGAGGKCQHFSGTKSGNTRPGIMYVCEEVPGWDPCSDGVATSL